MVIPRKELVGRNAKLQNGVYSDDYMTALNQFATVDEVFNQQKEHIAAGEIVVGRLVMDTLGKSEYENHLVALVMTAARAGEWRAVIRNPMVHNRGLDVVTEKHFGYVVEQEGKKFLLPSVLYVMYCQAQLQ